MRHGGVLHVMAIALHVRAVQYVLGRCTVCYGGALYAITVYCVLWWCNVW